ncbi:hypothetical protein VHN57_10165 [Sphingobium sp. WW5]|uniref:hypothetical protein n=1 Tax=unclassified Sphingobium TaxID=2611147 RepID=UPI00065CA2ED
MGRIAIRRGLRARIALSALASIVGIAGMLLAEGAWDWLFFMLAALPLLIGGAASAARKVRETPLDRLDRHPVENS